MLSAVQIGGIDEMNSFYGACVTELYPPGSCGTYCNTHTFDCYQQELLQSCCDEGGHNCPAESVVPQTCPVGCAIVFPEFFSSCHDHLAEYGESGDLSAFETFSDSCLELDGIALIEYVSNLIADGCSVNLPGFGSTGHRRRLQSWLSARFGGETSTDSTCTWDQIDDAAAEVDQVCCGLTNSQCANQQAPTQCSAACAVAFHSFQQNCAGTIETVMSTGADPMRDSMSHFEQFCIDTAADNDDFMTAIMNAHCPDEDDTIILREIGADSGAGWSNSEVTDTGSAGFVHGPWGNECTDVSISVAVPADVIECQVSWRSWEIDSRDNEEDRVEIDGVVVWAQTAHYGSSCSTGWEMGPSDFPNPWGSIVCFVENEVTVPCSGSLDLRFVSGVDQPESDESWAFSDVTIIGSTGNVVILRESGANPNGWSSATVTDTGSAGLIHGPFGQETLEVSQSITIPSEISACEVNFRSWAIGSRDNEANRVQVDGNTVWSLPAKCWLSDIGDGWELGPSDFDVFGRTDSGACFDEVSIQVPCSGTMELSFQSDVNQQIEDESWGFSDVEVLGYYAVTAQESCIAHLRENPAAQNGVFTIINGEHTYSAYCDMANGGWELAMRVQSQNSEFLFESEFWTNDQIYGSNEQISNPSPMIDADVKLPSFLYTNVEHIRGCLGGVSDLDCKSYDGMGDYSSLQDLFASVPEGTDDVALTFEETQEEMLGWLSINGLSCTDLSNVCNWYAAGINLDDTTGQSGAHGWEAGVRFGLLLNNENSIYTANDAVGFGCREANGGGVGAGHAQYPGILNPQPGSIWVMGR